ncbi:MAG: hypothetical protein ACXQS8_09885 [Candidatus Helarchaeales archaeon]
MSRSLLPFITEALNDVFSRMDKIQDALDEVNKNVVESLSKINKSIELLNETVSNLSSSLNQAGALKAYQENTKLLLNSIENVNENFWYLDLLTALRRILSVADKIKSTTT